MYNFHETHRKFPPGQVTGPLPEAGVTQAVNHGWGPFILPFIDQQPLFNKYRWDLKASDPLNQEVITTQLETFQCPSAEPNRYATNGPAGEYGGKSACGDYAPIWQVDPMLVEQRLIDRPRDYFGVLQPNHMTRLVEITDGASNTILLAEDAGRPRLWRVGRPGEDQTVLGAAWAAYGSGFKLQGSTDDGTMSPGPCAMNCTNEKQVYSFHPGGANAVFADGSVHFLQAGMSIRILAALVTRAGGEIVSVTDY